MWRLGDLRCRKRDYGSGLWQWGSDLRDLCGHNEKWPGRPSAAWWPGIRSSWDPGIQGSMRKAQRLWHRGPEHIRLEETGPHKRGWQRTHGNQFSGPCSQGIPQPQTHPLLPCKPFPMRQVGRPTPTLQGLPLHSSLKCESRATSF